MLDLIAAEAPGGVAVRSVACLSGCKRACAVGVMAPGRVTYLFGDVPPIRHAASDIAAFATQYGLAAEGCVRRPDRPLLPRESILARLPPLVALLPSGWQRDGEIVWPA